MNNLRNTLAEKMKIDAEIAEMKRYPIDYSDIPPRKPGAKARLAQKEFLDQLPPDIVRELARRRLEELKAAGYDVPASSLAPSVGAEKSRLTRQFGIPN